MQPSGVIPSVIFAAMNNAVWGLGFFARHPKLDATPVTGSAGNATLSAAEQAKEDKLPPGERSFRQRIRERRAAVAAAEERKNALEALVNGKSRAPLKLAKNDRGDVMFFKHVVDPETMWSYFVVQPIPTNEDDLKKWDISKRAELQQRLGPFVSPVVLTWRMEKDDAGAKLVISEFNPAVRDNGRGVRVYELRGETIDGFIQGRDTYAS